LHHTILERQPLNQLRGSHAQIDSRTDVGWVMESVGDVYHANHSDPREGENPD
jgi:hypothetical protein